VKGAASGSGHNQPHAVQHKLTPITRLVIQLERDLAAHVPSPDVGLVAEAADFAASGELRTVEECSRHTPGCPPRRTHPSSLLRPVWRMKRPPFVSR
jgi:hypothetical protein